MTEDFIQNIQFDLFTVELVIGDTATLLMAENYVTIREVFVDNVKVEPNDEKQIFLPSGGDSLWELAEGDIVVPVDNRTYTSKSMYEVDVANGSTDKFLNKQGDFTKPINSHSDLINKNAETSFQHVDTTISKQTLIQADKVAIYDSVAGKVVLTNKSNVGGGGSTDIISTNATNNTGTIVIDTTPNWQRVNISGGGSTLILDYANGTLPTKNREYLLVINNYNSSTITLTLPTVSFIKGGITYNFLNTAGSVPIDKNRSIEVNVIFFFIDATTCNIRTQITQFI